MEETKTRDEEVYPGVDEAYNLVLASYQIMASRMEAADTRLAMLLTTASSLALGAPLLAKVIRPDICFKSPFFCAAIAFIALAFICGVVGRIRGKIVLLNPAGIYEKFLHKSRWLFRKDMVYFSGQHFIANAHTIDGKGRFATWMTALILASVLALVAWLAF
jgi:hypothetical protein